MAYINQRKYYTNDGVVPTDTNWGSYQYVSLDDIMTNFELMYDGNHSLVNNENRYKILFHAKRAIQELNYDAFKEIKALELTVYDDLRFVLPSDYVNWVKLYLFQGNTLRELTENIQVQSSIQYLQNSTAVFGYDGNNNVSTIESKLDTARNHIVGSIRNPSEVNSLREKSLLRKFFLISVDAEARLRYDRLCNRGRIGDSDSWKKFVEQERQEDTSDDPNKQQLSKTMSMADHIIDNSGTLDELEEQVKKIISNLRIKNLTFAPPWYRLIYYFSYRYIE